MAIGDETFTGARTSTGTRGPVFVGKSSKKKKKNPTIDRAAEQKKLRAAQEKAAIESIRRKEREALSGLERQEAEIKPRFTEARRATTAGSELAGQRFRESIAGQGLTGAGAEAKIRQTGALQRDIGGLRQQETEQFGDIARTRADIGRAAESDIASTKAGIQAQSIQDLINLRNQQRAEQLQEAQLTGQFRGQETLAGRQAREAGALRGLQTETARLGLEQAEIQDLVTRSQGDLMAAMIRLQQAGVPDNDPRMIALDTARRQKVLGQEQLQRQLTEEERLRTRQAEQDELQRQIALRELAERERAGRATRANIQSQIDQRAREAEVIISQGGATETAILNAASKLVTDSFGDLTMPEAVQEVRNALAGTPTQQQLTDEEIDRLLLGQ